MKLIIDGNVPSQKNGKVISVNRKTGARFIRSNDRVKSWQEQAVLELTRQFDGYVITKYPISVTIIFYFDNLRRHDLDNAAAGCMDALVKSKIIEDDNVKFVDCLTLQYGGLDKVRPRAEIFIDD